ncbi:MAG: hypothetical protein ACFB2X_09175 [Rivularia sp. (in: cyanobacteria)]
MFDNNKKVVSDVVALTGALMTPETAQATWNRANSNHVVQEANRKLSIAQQAATVSNKVKVTKNAFDNVKRQARKAINKATNMRNDLLKKVNQAEEIAEAAKEDWQTKVITAIKKVKNIEPKAENIHIRTQADQAIEDVENAKENFENKKSEAAKKRLQLEQYEEKLEAVIQEQNSKIEAAEMAYKQAQIDQQKAIQTANNPFFAMSNWTKEYTVEDRLKDNLGLKVLIS